MILAATWDGRVGELHGAAQQAGDEVTLATFGGAPAAGGSRVVAFTGDPAAAGAEAVVAALADLAREVGARAVLLPADDRTAELAPRLAERLGGTAVLHAVDLEARDGRLLWTRPVYGGKALATVAAAVEPVVATLRRGAFPAVEAQNAAEAETRPLPEVGDAVRLVGVEAAAGDDAFEDARVIVSGGAGVGDGFAQLEELAQLLGGAVGASLAAVDAGWAPPERQVGLTGKVVSPEVYFAIGISGASQHLAGIGGAKTVVAVNNDPDAPIFARARLGVVADCRPLVSALIERLRSGG